MRLNITDTIAPMTATIALIIEVMFVITQALELINILILYTKVMNPSKSTENIILEIIRFFLQLSTVLLMQSLIE